MRNVSHQRRSLQWSPPHPKRIRNPGQKIPRISPPQTQGHIGQKPGQGLPVVLLPQLRREKRPRGRANPSARLPHQRCEGVGRVARGKVRLVLAHVLRLAHPGSPGHAGRARRAGGLDGPRRGAYRHVPPHRRSRRHACRPQVRPQRGLLLPCGERRLCHHSRPQRVCAQHHGDSLQHLRVADGAQRNAPRAPAQPFGAKWARERAASVLTGGGVWRGGDRPSQPHGNHHLRAFNGASQLAAARQPAQPRPGAVAAAGGSARACRQRQWRPHAARRRQVCCLRLLLLREPRQCR